MNKFKGESDMNDDLKNKFMIILASLFGITLILLMITSIIMFENYLKEVKERAYKYDLIINEVKNNE